MELTPDRKEIVKAASCLARYADMLGAPDAKPAFGSHRHDSLMELEFPIA